MFPVSVKISAIISGAKFAQAFQIHPVFLVKTGNADDSVQATEYAQAPGLPKAAVIYSPNLTKSSSHHPRRNKKTTTKRHRGILKSENLDNLCLHIIWKTT